MRLNRTLTAGVSTSFNINHPYKIHNTLFIHCNQWQNWIWIESADDVKYLFDLHQMYFCTLWSSISMFFLAPLTLGINTWSVSGHLTWIMHAKQMQSECYLIKSARTLLRCGLAMIIFQPSVNAICTVWSLSLEIILSNKLKGGHLAWHLSALSNKPRKKVTGSR